MPTAEKPRRHRAPAFVPVPTRPRADGWTPETQARFITALAKTRSVSAAARSVGLSRASAYKLRHHPQAHSFAAAWDAACHAYGQIKPRKLTPLAQWSHAVEPLIQPPPLTRPDAPILWKIDNKSLRTLLGRFTRAARALPPRHAKPAALNTPNPSTRAPQPCPTPPISPSASPAPPSTAHWPRPISPPSPPSSRRARS